MDSDAAREWSANAWQEPFRLQGDNIFVPNGKGADDTFYSFEEADMVNQIR